jgi:transcription antitermination factor NusG
MPDKKWVVVGLSSSGERETDIKTIANAVRRVLGRELEVFVPAISKKARDESHTLFYMDGYVFIQYQDGIPYMKLQDTSYFGQVLCAGNAGSMTYSLVDDFVLDPLRKGVKDLSKCKFSVGDRVRVIKGEFRNLRGEVRAIYESGEVVQVDVSQRSKPMLIDFPTIYLQKVPNE